MNPEDARLKAALKESRLSPPLPPRFRENVWRRIEDREMPDSLGAFAWLDTLVALVLRPRFAYAAVAILMTLGIWLGAHEGSRSARQNAEARYVSAVAPATLH